MNKTKPTITKKILSEWLIGVYATSTGLHIEMLLDKEKILKAKSFSDEVMKFLEEHNLLNPEMK